MPFFEKQSDFLQWKNTMGTSGNDISDNDQYSDLKIEFFELYNKAVPVDVISESIIKEHNENFDSDEDSNNF